MNKLFLSLSLLTIAFSAVAAEGQMGRMAKIKAQAVILGKAVADKAAVLGNTVVKASKSAGSYALNKSAQAAQSAKTFGVNTKSNLWDKSLTIRGHEFKHGRKIATCTTVAALTAGTIYAYKKGYFGKLYNYVSSTRPAGWCKTAGVKVADFGSKAMQYRFVSYPVAITSAIVKAPFKMAAYPFRKAAQLGKYTYSKLPNMPKFGKAADQTPTQNTPAQTTPATKSAPVQTPAPVNSERESAPVTPKYNHQAQVDADVKKHTEKQACGAGHWHCKNPKCGR